eukprot:TRINITY_DN12423_c0_g2_i1.p1 TRINITY_DN12423_c0_g2~~TRINITY_DN12423_c0_g2_i1.p1  ORF type:complete len:619 (+),score=171.13 TRINITY_DN12423_c0_g2_i1:38-1858(+)
MAATNEADAHCESLAQSEVLRLQKQLDEVYEMLANKEKDLQLSATIGQRLLTENQALNEKYQHNLQLVDELEQQAHDLRVELKSEAGSQELSAALETENNQLRDKCEGLEQKLIMVERDSNKAIKTLKAQVEKLEDDCATSQLQLSQAETKCQQQNDIIQGLQDQAQALANAQDLDTELAQCHARMADLETVLSALQLERCDLQSATQQLSADNERMRSKLDTAEGEVASLESKLSASRDAQEAMQDTVAALQIELQQYKSKNGNMGTGLDLFSEVEDKRIALEEAVRTTRMKCNFLQKRYDHAEHQRRSLNNQLRAMMQMHGSKADASKLQRLEASLSQERSEVIKLQSQVSRLEQANAEYSQRMLDQSKAMASSDNYAVLEFMRQEVQNAQEETAQKAKELRTVTLQRVSEGNKLHECQSKLHKAERQVEQLTSEVMQCKVKIQELEETIKYKTDMAELATPSARERSPRAKRLPLSEATALTPNESNIELTQSPAPVTKPCKAQPVTDPNAADENDGNVSLAAVDESVGQASILEQSLSPEDEEQANASLLEASLSANDSLTSQAPQVTATLAAFAQPPGKTRINLYSATNTDNTASPECKQS